MHMAQGNCSVPLFKACPYIIVSALMKQYALSETILPTYPGIYLGMMKQNKFIRKIMANNNGLIYQLDAISM